MKHKTLMALAGCGTLIQCSIANAQFLGIQIVDVSSWMSTVGPPNIRNSYNAEGGPAAYQVYRIFAMFGDSGASNADNRVNVISGLERNPWSLTLTSGMVLNWTSTYTLTHSPLSNNYPPALDLPGAGGLLGWETWATIGVQLGSTEARYTFGAVIPGQLNNFVPDFSADNAALYITPNDTQGKAIELNTTTTAGQGHTGFGVLLMQITVTTGSMFNGQFNLNIGAPGSTQDVLGLTFGAVPAPGAMALFGIAGLIGSRRRRA